MRYVIVSTSTRVTAPIQKAIDAVAPWLPAHVSLSVETSPLSTFLHNYEVTGTTAIVSPANSLSYMGGGFDRAVLDTLTGENTHYKILEAAIQQKALARHNGYIVPATVHKIDLAHAYRTANIDYHTTVAWRKRITTLIQVPTMVVPEQISKETVFDCMWNVLVECGQTANTVVLPAIGAGYGGVDPYVVGQVMAGAVGLFHMEMAPLARSAAILLFTGRDYRRFGLPSDISELEKYMTEEGRGHGRKSTDDSVTESGSEYETACENESETDRANEKSPKDRNSSDDGKTKKESESHSAESVGQNAWPMAWEELMRCLVVGKQAR